MGSPSSVAGAVAASAAAAAAAAASAAAAAAAAGVGGGERGVGATERLEQLKKEKRVLHVMLRNFEKDFKERNGHEVGLPCRSLASDCAGFDCYRRFDPVGFLLGVRLGLILLGNATVRQQQERRCDLCIYFFFQNAATQHRRKALEMSTRVEKYSVTAS